MASNVMLISFCRAVFLLYFEQWFAWTVFKDADDELGDFRSMVWIHDRCDVPDSERDCRELLAEERRVETRRVGQIRGLTPSARMIAIKTIIRIRPRRVGVGCGRCQFVASPMYGG